MNMIRFRLYGELNDYLPVEQRMLSFAIALRQHHTVQDMLEVLGVPCKAVDLIIVNGHPVAFDFILQPHDHVSVYPQFHSIDISPLHLINRQMAH